MNEIVLHNQSILDIAIQYTGDVQNCFAIATRNGFSVSDFLEAGSQIDILEDIPKNTDVLNEYKAKKIQPATGSVTGKNGEIPLLKGIGFMQIANSFKVS